MLLNEERKGGQWGRRRDEERKRITLVSSFSLSRGTWRAARGSLCGGGRTEVLYVSSRCLLDEVQEGSLFIKLLRVWKDTDTLIFMMFWIRTNKLFVLTDPSGSDRIFIVLWESTVCESESLFGFWVISLFLSINETISMLMREGLRAGPPQLEIMIWFILMWKFWSVTSCLY